MESMVKGSWIGVYLCPGLLYLFSLKKSFLKPIQIARSDCRLLSKIMRYFIGALAILQKLLEVT